MRSLFPEIVDENNKNGEFPEDGVRGQPHAEKRRCYQRTTKFALQTHRNFGSLAA
jgi:hypothetical protein